jgi:hypothetical protein
MSEAATDLRVPLGERPPQLLTLSESDLAQLDQPFAILKDPSPRSKLGQQVARLEQHSRHAAAAAVKVCGRRGEKLTYACGRSYLGNIIRSHLRFCCYWCDRRVAERTFDQHRVYREYLHPAGTLYQVKIKSRDYPISSDGIRDFESSIVEAVRRAFKRRDGWGFKSWTDYEDGCLVAKGIIYLPPGTSLPPDGLQVPSATCTVGGATSVTAFEEMLREILKPCPLELSGSLSKYERGQNLLTRQH